MTMLEEAERSNSLGERHISSLERHIQNLEAAGMQALRLHEKIQAVLNTKREALRELQTTAAVRPELD